MRRAVTSPARDRIARCDDMVFCGTASALAMSPAASPSGSCFVNNRNTSRRVDWASAASARMAFSDSIYPDLSIYYSMSTRDTSVFDPELIVKLSHRHLGWVMQLQS